MHTAQFNFKQVLVILAIVSLTLVSSVIFTSPVMAANGINRTINFQGRLVRNDSGNVGLNVANNTYSVIFTFYNNGTAGQGTALWSETQTVTTTDGIFRVALGSVTPIPANFNFNWDGLYLGIKVGADAEMTPRITMAAVPFAFNAQQVAGLTIQDSTSGAASTSATLKIGDATTPVIIDMGAVSGKALVFANTATTGNLSSLTDSTSQTGDVVGLNLTLSGANGALNQTGIKFNLSGGTGANYYDLYGSGGSWAMTRAGAIFLSGAANSGYGNNGDCLKSGGGSTSVMTFGSCGGAGGTNYWNLALGVNGGYISPINSTADFLVGSQSTSSAAFAVLGLATNNLSGVSGHQTTASVSGNLILMPNNGYGGQLGIGTTAPAAGYALDVRGNSNIGNQLATQVGGIDTLNINQQATVVNQTYVNISGSLQAAPASDSTGYYYGGLFYSQSQTGNASNLSGRLVGFQGQVNHYATGLLTEARGFAGFVMNNNSGTITNAYGGKFSNNNAGTGTITNAYGIDIQSISNGGGGNIYNNYGLYVEDQSSAGWLNSFNVYSVGSTSKNFFAGSLQIGGTAATLSAAFDVTGNASFAGQLTFKSTFGTIQTTADQQLTLGGNTTGKILLSAFNGQTISIGGTGGINLAGYTGSGSGCTLKTDASGNVQCQTDLTGGGGGGYSPFAELTGVNGGVIVANNSTMDVLLGGQSTASAGFRVTGQSNPFAGTISVASVSGDTSFAALVIDNSIGDLLTASSAGDTRFVVRQNGSTSIGSGAEINAGYTLDVLGSARIGNSTSAGDDIYKATSADFTVSGSNISQNSGSGYNTNQISTANNQMTLITDLLGAGATITTAGANGTGTGQAMAAGTVAFQRADSTFVVVAGGSNVARIYDPTTNAFKAGFTTPGTTVGAGSQALQRQNGSFVIIAGGNTGNTTLYYPGGGNDVGSAKNGPPLMGPRVPATGQPAQSLVGAGSQVLRKSDGKFLLLLGGGSVNTNIYDPVATSSASPSNDLGNFDYGPQLTGAVNAGSFAFETIFGKWIIGLGGNGLNMYDPTTGAFTNIVSTTGWVATSTGAGAHVIQRPDYKYLIILGGNTQSTIVYDPVTNAFSAGPTIQGSTNVNNGAHSFQRSDGKWVTVLGSATSSTGTNIYDPADTTGTGGGNAYGKFTDPGASGYLANAAGAGAITFQRPDGKYIVVSGGGALTYTIYDAGWNTTGTWTSENLTSANISTYSAILWSGDPQAANNNARLDKSTIDVFVKTAPTAGGLAAVPWSSVANSGDLLGGYLSSGAVQIKVTLNAPVRSYPQLVTSTINQSNIWGGEGNTFNRRAFLTPSIFSIRIQNPLVQYGGGLAADPQYGRNFATAGALLEGVATNNRNQLALAINRNLPTATTSAGFIIASASANIGFAVGTGGSTAFSMPNGQTMLIQGNGNTATRIYDPDSNTWSAGPVLPGAANIGTHAIFLPSGKTLVVLGGSTKTAIYDPPTNSFYLGPTLTANAAIGANSFQRPDGLFIIMLGGAAGTATQGLGTNIYDPFLNQITFGPSIIASARGGVGGGSFTIIRPDGRIEVILGDTTAVANATDIYDYATNAFVQGPVGQGLIQAGATAVQLYTGKILVAMANSTATNIQDPISMAWAAGPTLAAVNGAGSAWIQRPDGKALLINGNSTLATQVYDPQTNAFVVGPTLPCSVAAGGLIFQRPDGAYVLVCGGASQVSAVIDPGWNLGGSYFSEQVYEPNLNVNTALYWQNVGQGTIYAKYRTAADQVHLGVAGWKDAPISGSKINFTTGDQWIQVRFDLNGSLPGMPGAQYSVWPGTDGGGPLAYYRTVVTPILSTWKLMDTSTPNVLTLTANGSNAFRFSADGQAYTAPGGAWNSGGADLAENYSSTQTLQPGEVVVGDKLNTANVERSTNPYQTNIMGVVSTKPGFVAGAYTPDAYPIALVGRVPVKISTENGAIHSGDYLTSASIPGYAMKATVAGRVLGTALQDFDPNDPSQIADCPADGAGSLSTTQCGTITAFINLTNYNGQNVELAMADDNFTASPSGLSQPEINTGLTSYVKQISAGDQNILAYLESLHSAAFNSSEVFAGKVAAGEIISPNIVADLITAKTIRADHIEGLEILTNQLSALTNSMAVLSDATQSGEFATSSAYMPTSLNLSSLNVNGFATISADLNVQGSGFFQGALNVLSDLTTKNLLVSQFAYFINDVVFKGNVRFNSTPTFNNDTAGFAVIKQGLDTVQVNFNQEYVSTPIVTASIALNKTGDSVSQKTLEDQILNGNISYVITQRTTKGFVIKLSKLAVEDINFSWVSLSVQDAKTSGLNIDVAPVPAATNSAAFQSVLDQLNLTPTPAVQ